MHGPVTIFGAGEIGKALGTLLGEKGVEVIFYDKNSVITNLSEIIFLCVPTKAIFEVYKKISLLLGKEHIIITVSKGLDSEGKATYQLMNELFDNCFGWGVMGGPMLAEELTKGLEGSAVAAVSNTGISGKITEVFSNTNLKLEFSTDTIGVSLCGVLKNIYSIALGNFEGKKLGNNAKGRLVTQIVKEMSEIVVYYGGQKETVYSLAGLGDLIATGFSTDSSNTQVGIDFALDRKTNRHSEGLSALPIFIKRFDDLSKYPVLKSTADLVLNFSPMVEVQRKAY